MAQDIFCLDLGLPGDPPPAIAPFNPKDPSTYIDETCQLYDPFSDDAPPTPERKPLTPWPPSLPVEIALGADSMDNILLRNGVTEEEDVGGTLTPAFRRALAEAAKDIRENGLTFRGLCRGIAEDFLPELDQKLHDKLIPFAQKLDALKSVVKWAGLEPKEEKAVASANSNLVNIQINL